MKYITWRLEHVWFTKIGYKLGLGLELGLGFLGFITKCLRTRNEHASSLFVNYSFWLIPVGLLSYVIHTEQHTTYLSEQTANIGVDFLLIKQILRGRNVFAKCG